jgi:aldehyde dehydrogenase (NAD+)
VRETIELCRFFQGEGLRLDEPGPGQDPHSHRRPLGVCAILSGNSSPLAGPCWKLIPALLYGNTVVWKPSVNAPTTAYLLIRCMMDAGLAPGVVNVVNGKGRAGCGKFFVAGIDKGFYQMFSFTGSTAMGRTIGELAGRNLIIPSLELGGKNAMIVMPDCDLDRAVACALDGAFGSAGQRRTALANLILHQDVAEAFKAKFLSAAAAMTMGNPVTDPEVFYGPMINARFANAFEEHWALGLEDGARLLTGGARWTEENRTGQVLGFVGKGFYMQPCIWDEVTPQMALFQTEVFGPTVNLSTVDSFDQALAYANGTPYGLVSSLHSENREWIERFKRESDAGAICINDASAAVAHRPFGGTGWSGNGTHDAGARLEDGYTRLHAVHDHAEAAPRAARVDGAGAHPYEPSHWDRL